MGTSKFKVSSGVCKKERRALVSLDSDAVSQRMSWSGCHYLLKSAYVLAKNFHHIVDFYSSIMLPNCMKAKKKRFVVGFDYSAVYCSL